MIIQDGKQVRNTENEIESPIVNVVRASYAIYVTVMKIVEKK